MSAPVRRPRWWKHPAVRIAGSVLLLAMLFTILPFHEIRAAIASVPWWVWPVALGTYMCLHLIGVAKWRLLTNVAGAGLTFGGASRAYYWGLFGNTFLPSTNSRNSPYRTREADSNAHTLSHTATKFAI